MFMFGKSKRQILNKSEVFDKNNYPQLINAHKKYEKLDKLSTSAFLKHEKLMKSTGCLSCVKYFEDMNRPIEERNKNCDGCEYSYIGESHVEFLNATDNVERFIQNEYSKIAFDVLSELKPDLIRQSTGRVYSWKEVFPETFEECDKNNRIALISIVEEKGGPYRIKKN